MFTRQKTLIYLLKLAQRPVSHTELTKWCFLLRNDAPSGGGSAFYDFVPYHFGPFSFSLYQEVDKLVSQGYLEEEDRHWTLNPRLADEIDRPSGDVERDARRLVSRFQTTQQDKLIDYVYERFPEYTVNSKLRKLRERPTAPPAVYTAGYEGLSVDSFLNLLVTNGIRRLIDVRNNPIARRYGFHKSTLHRLTGRLDIEYLHLPQLGIKSQYRENLSDQASYDALFEIYEQTTLQSEQVAINETARLLSETASVLVCMEAEPCSCHRSRLANRVASITDLPVIHLKGNK